MKLNDVEFKAKCLFIQDARVNPKVTNPNTRTFTSPDWFKPLRFMNNRSALGNNIDNSEESVLHINIKRTARNYLQNFKYIFEEKSQVVVSTRP